MATLERAIQIAVNAHAGQTDKSGQPYSLHVLRVMFRCNKVDQRIVAVLHDTVEDTKVTFDDLRAEGFSDDLLAALDCVTHREDETYDAYVDRIKQNSLAISVKLADLEDNMDIRRLAEVRDKDLPRLKKYRRVYEALRKLT